MSTETPVPIRPEVMAELRAAANAAAIGIRDPESMKRAADRMDRRAEKNAELFGVQDVGVEVGLEVALKDLQLQALDW